MSRDGRRSATHTIDPMHDSGTQRAIAEKVVDEMEERGLANPANPSDSRDEMKEITKGEINEHKIDCWSETGFAGKIKKDVESIKSWGRAIGLTILALQALNAVKGWAQTQNTPSAVGTAHAEQVKATTP